MAARTKRVAAKSIAAIPAEAIAFIGVAVLVADTSYELYAACQNLRDLDQLYTDLDMDEAIADDAVHTACNPELPDPREVWKGVMQKSSQWWQRLADEVSLSGAQEPIQSFSVR